LKFPDSTNTNKVVAIFDLDKTITRKDTYLAFLVHLLRRHPTRILRSTWLPFAVFLYKLRLRDNSWLKKTFLQSIAGGMSRTQITLCTHQFLDTLIKQGLRPSALQAIKCHKDADHQLILATASFDFYTQELGHRLGFDKIICTQSCWDDNNNLLGKIKGENCYGENKLARLAEYFGDHRHQLHLIGYTDHHSDTPFLQWVDQAVAINPTHKLRKIANLKGFAIENWEKK
jgi:phosphatidylglycerophosphatase C